MQHHAFVKSSCVLAWTAWILLGAGCASITNPVANGVPARLLPEELLAESKEETEPLPLAWLKVKPPELYTLDTGDILGVYIEGALGDRSAVPPIHFPQVAGLPPSVGYPIPIGESGDVSLPLVKRVNVRGLTLEEAQEKIIEAYTGGGEPGAKEFLGVDQARILVTLVRPRQVRILLVREDSPNQRVNVNDPDYRLFGSAPYLSNRGQGSGSIIELPETEADVLSVLAQSGGLPGPTASNEVIIYRGFNDLEGHDLPAEWTDEGPPQDDQAAQTKPRTIRIPLRIRPGSSPPFGPDDIHLRSGDIVFIASRETDVYYTGGLMPAREVPLPRDYDMRVIEAILRVGGPVLNGGQFLGSFSGQTAFARGLGNPSPSLLTVLRRTPGGGQIPIRVSLNRALRDNRENLLVMPGDVLLLQETPAEAVARYISGILRFGALAEVFGTSSSAGTVNIQGP